MRHLKCRKTSNIKPRLLKRKIFQFVLRCVRNVQKFLLNCRYSVWKTENFWEKMFWKKKGIPMLTRVLSGFSGFSWNFATTLSFWEPKHQISWLLLLFQYRMLAMDVDSALAKNVSIGKRRDCPPARTRTSSRIEKKKWPVQQLQALRFFLSPWESSEKQWCLVVEMMFSTARNRTQKRHSSKQWREFLGKWFDKKRNDRFSTNTKQWFCGFSVSTRAASQIRLQE